MKNLSTVLLAMSASCFARGFQLSDVHFWAGEGTNAAALVVDWSADGAAPLAWGWRWNGSATVADALHGIVREDPRLHALGGGPDRDPLYALGYDRADVAAAFRFDFNGGNVVAEASDDDALVAGGWLDGYWRQWTANASGAFDASSLGYGNGLSATPLADGSWHVLQFQRPEWGWNAHPLSGEPVAAESPYAWRVVAADVAAGGDYGDPDNALGGPSRSVPGFELYNIPPTTVNPASSAWGPGRLVTLESRTNGTGRGSITVEFDHPVVDDPRNPFGLDFIVFGNPIHTIGDGVWFDGVSDPATVRFGTGDVGAEPGLVEVSADGATWFVFADGPWADGFAPTLSHRYDPENPDRSLFGDAADTNEWWGAPTDATRPVDPTIAAAAFQGRTLADYARLYDGSAGGTGFDISSFDLPRDALGRRFVRFVRITSLDPNDNGDFTEVDAVADVAPAPSFRNWVDAHVAFEDRPGFAKTNLCANGAPAFANAALGLAPDAPAPAAWAIEGFDPATGALAAPFAPFASDLVFLRSAATLTNAAWVVSLPHWSGTNALGRPLLLVPDPEAPSAFFRLELHE